MNLLSITSRYLIFLLLPGFLMCSQETSVAQSRLFFNSVDTTAFPLIQARVRVVDSKTGEQAALQSGDFELLENGQAVANLSVQCPPKPPSVPLSSVLVIDVSGSMNYGLPTNMSIAKAAANAWVSLLPSHSECAIVSFDNNPYLNQDFTNDKSLLNKAIQALQPQSGTDYDQGLITSPMSALRLIAGRPHKPVIIFLTDGVGTCTVGSVLALAKQYDAQVFCVCVNLVAPLVLHQVADGTGALLYDAVRSESEVVAVYQDIFAVATQTKSCIMQWRSSLRCELQRHLQVLHKPTGLKAQASYSVDKSLLPGLFCSPQSLHFDSIQVGVAMTKSFTIEATADSTRIDSAVSTSAFYSVEGFTPPLLLMKGEKRTFTLRCLVSDSALHSCAVKFYGNFCSPAAVFGRCGYRRFRGSTEHMTLLSPNGSERYLAGSLQHIRWKGLLPDDRVRLEYSLDDGQSWNFITDTASNFEYAWRLPFTNSSLCRVRALQLQDLRREDSVVIIRNAHVASALSVAFSPDATLFVSSGADNALRFWDATNGSPYGASINLSSLIGTLPSVAWSSDPNIIAIAGTTGAAYFSTITMQSLRRLPSNSLSNQMFRSCDFTSDGKYLLLSTNLARVVIWSVEAAANPNQEYLNLATTHSTTIRSVRSVRYNAHLDPSSLSFVCASEDRKMTLSTARIQDQNSALQLLSMQAGKESFQAKDQMWSASASPTSTLLVGGALNGEMLLASGQVQNSFYPVQSDAITQTAWSPDGKTIALGYNSGRIVLWDVASKSVVSQLDTLRASLLGLCWDPYSSMIVASYYDGSLLMWRRSTPVLQSDKSDSSFSIVMPTLNTTNVLDFGKRFVGASSDSVLQQLVCIDPKQLASLWTAKNLRIVNDVDSCFTLVSAVPLSRYDSSSFCFPMEFRFQPKKVGVYSARVEYTLNDSLMTLTLNGEAVQPALQLASGVIDFGAHVQGTKRDSVVQIVLLNTTQDTVLVNGLSIFGPDRTQFLLLSGADTLIAPKSQLAVTLRFNAQTIGATSSSLRAQVQLKNSNSTAAQQLHLSLFGRVLCGADSTSPEVRPLIQLDTSFGQSDSTVSLGQSSEFVLRLNAQPTQLLSLGDSCELKLSYRSSTLILIEPNVQTRVEGDRHTAWLSTRRSGDSLLRVLVLPLLGDSDHIDLQVDSLLLSGACGLRFGGAQVHIPIANVCMAGGEARLLTATAVTSMRVQQNEQDLDVHLSLAESGVTQLELFDLLGRKQSTVFHSTLQRGDQHLHLQTPKLSSGLYLLVLQTPSERRSTLLQIQ